MKTIADCSCRASLLKASRLCGFGDNGWTVCGGGGGNAALRTQYNLPVGDIEKGDALPPFEGLTEPVRQAAVIAVPDARFAASAGGTVWLTSEMLSRPTGCNDRDAVADAQRADGTRQFGQPSRHQDLKDGRAQTSAHPLQAPPDAVNALVFCQTSLHRVSRSCDQTIRVWQRPRKLWSE
jgi:WD40 repeat protein